MNEHFIQVRETDIELRTSVETVRNTLIATPCLDSEDDVKSTYPEKPANIELYSRFMDRRSGIYVLRFIP